MKVRQTGSTMMALFRLSRLPQALASGANVESFSAGRKLLFLSIHSAMEENQDSGLINITSTRWRRKTFRWYSYIRDRTTKKSTKLAAKYRQVKMRTPSCDRSFCSNSQFVNRSQYDSCEGTRIQVRYVGLNEGQNASRTQDILRDPVQASRWAALQTLASQAPRTPRRAMRPRS